jgi:hypothetical protein
MGHRVIDVAREPSEDGVDMTLTSREVTTVADPHGLASWYNSLREETSFK